MKFIQAHGLYLGFWILWALLAAAFIHYEVGRIVGK